MKDRVLTLLLACGALALFYALFAPKPTPKGEEITLPLSSERGPNGYFGVWQWLASERIGMISLRDRYDKLERTGSRRDGNLLITTMPHKLGVRKGEIERLRKWIASGNTLLIMAGLADTPDWAMDGHHSGNLIRELGDLIDIDFETIDSPNGKASADSGAEKPKKSNEQIREENRKANERLLEAFKRLLKPAESEIIPTGTHPLFATVNAVKSISEYPASEWKAKPAKDVSAIVELAHVSAVNDHRSLPSLWLARMGDGQLIVSGFASPFVNKLIGERDNAQLLSNIVSWSVLPGGSVIFDDTHQGAVAFYDPQAFFNDARLHRALAWILLLWLVFVLGPSHLRAVRSKWNPVDIMSFVRATGGFMARTLPPAEAERRALALFFNAIRHRVGLPENGAPVWEWLESQGRVAAADVSRLREQHQKVAAGNPVDFAELHNLLGRIKGSFV